MPAEPMHTPGPWITQWEHGGEITIWSRDGGTHMIATCHAEDMDRVVPVKGNTSLIIAAPDMLAVLRECLGALDYILMTEDETPVPIAGFLDPMELADLRGRRDRVRAAITKAEGTSPGMAPLCATTRPPPGR